MEYSPPGGVLVCRFLGVERGDPPLVHLESEGTRIDAALVNPGALAGHGDLPYGAEIRVRLGAGKPPHATLLIDESDRLTPELAGLLSGLEAAPFGMAGRDVDGWRYLFLDEGEESDHLLEGKLELEGFTARLAPARRAIEVKKRWLDRVAEALAPFSMRVSSITFDGVLLAGDDMPELRAADLEGPAFAALATDLGHSLYWAEGFDPDFYRRQARAGFIAVSMDRGDRVFLIPELQEAYAVLDWENLHRSRSLERLFRSGRLEALGARLTVEEDIEAVLEALAKRWRAHTWLLPEYLALVRRLAREPRRDFRLRAIGLRLGDGELVAGELGYTIGRTYTSLTGFHRRERPEWNDLGKVQLQLLALLLRDRGYDFWNLGHPYMQYKLDLGAKVIDRGVFLEKWGRAVAEADPGLTEAEAG